MTENKLTPENSERLDELIESLLQDDKILPDRREGSSDLDPKIEGLYLTAKKIIEQNSQYQGPPQPSSNSRLALMTEFRSQIQQKEPKTRTSKTLFATPTFRWVAAVGASLLVLVGLSWAFLGLGSNLTATAGANSSWLPILILIVAAVIGIVLLIRKR